MWMGWVNLHISMLFRERRTVTPLYANTSASWSLYMKLMFGRGKYPATEPLKIMWERTDELLLLKENLMSRKFDKRMRMDTELWQLIDSTFLWAVGKYSDIVEFTMLSYYQTKKYDYNSCFTKGYHCSLCYVSPNHFTSSPDTVPSTRCTVSVY